jgi:hypothetical protein
MCRMKYYRIANIKYIATVFFLLLSIKAFSSAKVIDPYGEKTLSKAELLDKVKGGWAGKTIACTYGGPIEFQWEGTMVQDYVPIKWNNESIKGYYDTFPGLYDDVYVNLTFVDVINRLGLDAPADSFAVAFAHAGYPLWHANQAAHYNILNGIMPPASGYWKNNPHADDIDFQIESDFAGIMSPGMPNSCSYITDKVGHIMTYGNGWYGGVYISTLYTLAYISHDINFVVNESLKKIPSRSSFYQCISDVIRWHKEYPNDWKRTWFECQKKWSSDIGCPDGVFTAFDIDALINSAYVTIGLLYGQGDFGKSVDIAVRCGQDADSGPANVGGIMGTMLGYSHIPDYWKSPVKCVEDRPFSHSSYSLNKAYQVSYSHALMMIKKNEGRILNDDVVLKCQKPVPVHYEKSFEGLYPVDKVPVGKSLDNDKQLDVDIDAKGVVFRGYSSCSSNDKYVANVKVFIDGKEVDVLKLPLASQDTRKVDVYWNYDLENGKHVVSFKWLNPEQSAQVYIGDAIIYKGVPK